MIQKSTFTNVKYRAILYLLFLLAIPSLSISGNPEDTQEPKRVEADRFSLLQSRASTFRLSIFYRGPWPKCHRRVTFYVPRKNVTDSDKGKQLTTERTTQISRDEAIEIIKHLRSSGLLEGDLSAQTAIDPNNGQPDAQFVMEYGSWILKSGEDNFYRNLGWGLPMLKCLEGLSKVVHGESRSAMEWLLERPRSYRQHWEFVEKQRFGRNSYSQIRWPSPIPIAGRGCKPGTWKSGDWTYNDDWVRDKSKRVVTVKYGGKTVIGEKSGDYIRTPWGALLFNAEAGWMHRQLLFGLTPNDMLRNLTPKEAIPIKMTSPVASEEEMISDLTAFIVTTTNSRLRTEAIDDLGSLGPVASDAVPHLVEIFRTEGSPYVRQITAGALGRIGPKAKEAIPALTDALRDRQLERNARNALQNIQTEESAQQSPAGDSLKAAPEE